MTATIHTHNTSAPALTIDRPLMGQLITHLGNSEAYRAGKAAYDYLDHARSLSAVQIQAVLTALSLQSIRLRDLRDHTDAALAVAAAALLDGSKGRRFTGAERIDAALEILDDKLAGGW